MRESAIVQEIVRDSFKNAEFRRACVAVALGRAKRETLLAWYSEANLSRILVALYGDDFNPKGA